MLSYAMLPAPPLLLTYKSKGDLKHIRRTVAFTLNALGKKNEDIINDQKKLILHQNDL